MAEISTTPAQVIEFNDDETMLGRDPYLADTEEYREKGHAVTGGH